MLFASNCMIVKEFPSTGCIGIDGGCGFGSVGGWVVVCLTASAISPVPNSSVLRCVLKTRTLQMYPTRTTIAQIAHPTTCDIASTHLTFILGSRARVWVYIS